MLTRGAGYFTSAVCVMLYINNVHMTHNVVIEFALAIRVNVYPKESEVNVQEMLYVMVEFVMLLVLRFYVHQQRLMSI